METALLWFVVLTSLAYVALPFFARPNAESKRRRSMAPALEDLLAERDNLLAAIKDLEFDLEMGKISREDFNPLIREYRQKASRIFQSLEKANGKKASLKRLDRELQALAQKSGNKAQKFCPNCGARVLPQYRFCSQCGHPLKSRA
ncbi:MAG: zinc-ribbon domain-containing protein [Calditrichaeota bacterium]|nr:MAG: zinc-ribbon domain-containing protein [Calditrichota bacterium]